MAFGNLDSSAGNFLHAKSLQACYAFVFLLNVETLHSIPTRKSFHAKDEIPIPALVIQEPNR